MNLISFAGVFEMLGINFKMHMCIIVKNEMLQDSFSFCCEFHGIIYRNDVPSDEHSVRNLDRYWCSRWRNSWDDLYNESKDIKRVVCILVILGSTIGLKLVS